MTDEPEAPASSAEPVSRQTPTPRCLMELVEELHSSLDLDAGLSTVANRLRSLLPYDILGILLLDDLGKELSFRFAIGYPPEVVEHWRFGLGQGLVGTAARTGRPLRVGDVRTDKRYIQGVDGLASELAVPLLAKGRTVGVLDLGAREPDYFTETDVEWLVHLSRHIANAIENARLHENIKEQARTLSVLHQVSRELTSILDRDELLERVAQLVRQLIDFDVFTLILWNEELQHLEPVFSLYRDELLEGRCPIRLGDGISGTAAALHQPLRVPNVHLDPRYVACDHGKPVSSELAVPVQLKDHLMGVLDLESVKPDAFTAQHEQLLTTLGSYIAIALDNASLYEQLQEREARQAQELETAREIQKNLLPKASPWVPCLQIAVAYTPARQLGGDLYDFLPYGGGRTAIAVGDVAGKASPAALYGSLAIGILRGNVMVNPHGPAKVLELMNHQLLQLHLDNRFLALAFAVFDCDRHQLTVANSGLPRPYLVHGGEAREVPAVGVPLGLLPGRSYQEQVLDLVPDDVVVFYSDGITECLNRQEEEFGEERLEEVLAELGSRSARDIADGVIAATDRFLGLEGEAGDDRTVVVLKMTGE
jgi:sigma-B regulation protein RsbU (phosphoserine phosphatase)